MTILLHPFIAAALAVLALDESPAAPGEWGFRPSQDQPTDINPPSLTWRPIREAAAYDLQIADAEDFANVVYEVNQTPWSAHAPSRILEPGVYYWRYRAHGGGDPSSWSATRSFHVPPDAVSFPKPATDELIARIPENHPRLFVRPEEIPEFRGLAAGDLSARLEALVQASERLIAEPPDTTEPPKYPEGMERKSGEWRDMWWGNRLRTIAVVDGAATLAFTYRLTGGERYGKAARDLLMAFADWDPKGSTQYDYNDEAGMPALYFPARAYTWAYPMLSEADRAKLVSVMTVRGEDCFDHLRRRQHLWKPYASHSNRAWHFLGELAIAFIDTIPDAPKWLDYAMTIFHTAYPVWHDTDGGWHEGVAYWVSYQQRFMYWAFNMDTVFGVNVFERPFFQQTGYYGMYAMPPGSRTGGFADQAPHTNSNRIASFMAIMAAAAQNPHWKWYADQHNADYGGGYLGFIYAARSADLEASPPDNLPSSKAFYGTGLAFLNSNLLDGQDNVQIAFKSSPFGRQSHGHNANNAFLLNVNGQRVLRTAGRREVHGSPHHYEYMHHSKSDNAILVNGKGQIKHSPRAQGHISAFHTSDPFDVVVGEAAASYENLDRWTRRIIFLKPSAVVIHDLLDTPEPATCQYTLHAGREFLIDPAANAVTLPGGADNIRFTFLHPAGLAFSQTDEHDVPLAEWTTFELDEWHLTAETADPNAHQEFLTVIQIGDAEVSHAHRRNEDGAIHLTVGLPGANAELVLERDTFEVTRGGVRQRF